MLPDAENIAKRKFVTDKIKEMLVRNIDSVRYLPEDLHDDVALVGSGLGLDSLDILEVAMFVEGEFGVKLSESNLAALRSINTLADFIMQESSKGAANA